ncbi:polysaccharide biosynthesis/export family protein [Sphingomonas bacterium]|uniref:polysaccharide biosynthesis/export family protein n=1 Tax=Sphingomonas bacterium TaxID=1895847 RepID=UPI001576C502|nr:polysaccharide biosynthesis/export family protein [Sphingomonas bacterium]
MHTPPNRWFDQRRWTASALALLATGCATLPSSGPTGREIQKSIADATPAGQIRIVEVADAASLPVSDDRRPVPFTDSEPAPTDRVGPGDVLDITVYEAGIALFGGGSRVPGDGTGFDPSAKVEKLPPNRVDDDGFIQLPFTGRLRVAGDTVAQVARRIRTGYLGLSQNPQVLVSIREDITNSVIVGGEVGKPGRLILSTNRETLSDAIALAGGYRGDAKDLAVRVLRRNVYGDLRLSDVLTGSERDLRVQPGDRVLLLRAPRSFSVMGAPGRVEQLPFSGSTISLAEAISTAGGANPNLGDPKAIFIFRNTVVDGQPLNVVYHINMMRTSSYFLAQRFTMRDKDILYFGNARANQPSKLIQTISQLFSPIVAITSGVSALR